MRRLVIVLLAIAAGGAAVGSPHPAAARATVRQGALVQDAIVVRTRQREVHAFPSARAGALRLGRLPRDASPFVSNWTTAWSVTTGKQRRGEVALVRISDDVRRLERSRPTFAESVGRRVRIGGVAGADARRVFLVGGLHFDIETNRIEPGHLAEQPDLEVVSTQQRAGNTFYLARETGESSSGGESKLWLLAADATDRATLRVEAGTATGDDTLSSDPESVYVISGDHRIHRYSQHDLRFAEDLTPMLPRDPLAFFSADDQFYWLQTRTESGLRLWRMDRELLDGEPFEVPVPDGYSVIGDAGSTLWFSALNEKSRRPVYSADKGDTSARAYRMASRGQRRWRRLGRNVVRGAAYTGIVIVAVVVAPVVIPMWAIMAAADLADGGGR